MIGHGAANAAAFFNVFEVGSVAITLSYGPVRSLLKDLVDLCRIQFYVAFFTHAGGNGLEQGVCKSGEAWRCVMYSEVAAQTAYAA